RRGDRAWNRDLGGRAVPASRAAAQGGVDQAAQGDRQEHRGGAAVRDRVRVRRAGGGDRSADGGRTVPGGPGGGHRDRHRRAVAPLVIDGVPVIAAHEPWLTLIGLRLVWERNTSRETNVFPGADRR